LRADDVEDRKPQTKLMWLAIALVPFLLSGITYFIVSSIYPSEEKRWARSEAERIESDRRTKEILEQAQRDKDNTILSWRERSPWMFSGDDRFNEPGTIPPQKLGVPPTGHRGSVVSLALIGDGRNFLSASGDGTIKFWDMEKTIPLRDAGLHGGSAREVRLLPGGAMFISGGDDSQIVVRALIDGKVLYRISAREYGHVRSLEVAADGKRVLCLYEKGVVVWDLDTKTATRVLKDTGATVADMSTDGKVAVLGGYDGKLLAWEIDAGSEPRQIGSHQHGVFAVAIMPDGKRVVSGGGGDYVLRMRDLATGDEIRSFAAHKAVTYTIEVSADGKRMVSGSHDGTARLWDAETGEEITRLDQSNTVRAVAFVADGTILTAGDDRSIRLWSKHGFRQREFAGVAKE
jgi:WD40 repeat protein